MDRGRAFGPAETVKASIAMIESAAPEQQRDSRVARERRIARPQVTKQGDELPSGAAFICSRFMKGNEGGWEAIRSFWLTFRQAQRIFCVLTYCSISYTKQTARPDFGRVSPASISAWFNRSTTNEKNLITNPATSMGFFNGPTVPIFRI